MVTIKLNSNIQIVNGPQIAISIAEAIESNAYEKIEFILNSSKKEQIVTLSEKINFLLIKSDLDNTGAVDKDKMPTLTYTVDKNSFTLDTSHLFFGEGLITGLGIKFDSITFTLTPAKTDDQKKNVKVEILVGSNINDTSGSPQ